MTSTLNAATLRAGLRAAVVVAVAGLLAARRAGATKRQQGGPLVLKSASYFYVGGNIDAKAKGSPIVGHMYVEYMIRSVALALSDRDGSRRQRDRHELHRHARWPRRLGAVFRAPGYAVYIVDQVARGARRTGTEYYGAVQPSRLQPGRGAFRRAGALPGVAAGQAAYAMARHGRPGDAVFDQFYAAQAVSVASFAEAAGDQPAGADRADGEDRPVDPDDPFAVRRICLAGRRNVPIW